MSKQKTINFGAGPSALPQAVLAQIKDDIPDWHEGMSVMEMGHRQPAITQCFNQAEADLRALLNIPEEFVVLFMHGGARTQFAAIPLNLLGANAKADYLISGHWSMMAYEEAKRYGALNIAGTSVQKDFCTVPTEMSFSDNAAYTHYTDNETFLGVEYHTPPESPHLLISDMTSNILTKPIDFSRYLAVYASAQKNLGISGVTVVIVRRDYLGKAHPLTPSILNYQELAAFESLYNTPPVFSWYVLGLMMKWAKSQGGIAEMDRLASQKSKLLYDFIDRSALYHNKIDPQYRSRMNISFHLPTDTLTERFLNEANQQGFKQLKGHRIVGGCRASLYNAMSIEGVEHLIGFLAHFEKNNS